MMISKTAYANLIGAWCTISVSAAFAAPKFEGLGDLPGGYFDSEALAVSADGRTVVGSTWSSDPNWDTDQLGFEAMRWTKREGLTALDGLPGLPDSKALSVSYDGSVIVGWSTFGNGGAHPFRWSTATGLEALPVLSGDSYGVAAAASADGSVIVGHSNRAGIYRRQAVRWSDGKSPVPIDLGAGVAESSDALGVSADGSVIVGGFYDGAYSRIFRWAENEGVSFLRPLPGHLEAYYPIVSGDGSTVAGQSWRYRGITFDAVIWHQESGTTLLAERPVGIGSIEPRGISFDGSIIVGIVVEDEPYSIVHPFIWTHAAGLRDLEDVIVNDMGVEEAADWHLGYATGISSDGRVIVGYGVNPSGDEEAWIARLPARWRHDSK